jgi:membrane-associated phospholipid phosphatase
MKRRLHILFKSKIEMKNLFIYVIICFVLCIPDYTTAQSSDKGWPTFLQHSGDVFQVVLPAGAFLETIVNKDKEGIKQFAFSFGTNFLATHALKRLIRKKRPDPSTALNAMPSGHTSSAFQGATFIHIRYGPKYGIPAYLLAAYVGYSRVEGVGQKHDIWDVLGGAALGTLSSYLFTTTKDKSVVITPTLTSSSVSLSFQFNIK